MSVDLDNLPYDPLTIFNNPLVEVTQSALLTALTCEQKYVLRYLLLLAPQSAQIPLLIGRAFHSAKEYSIDPQCAERKDANNRTRKEVDIVHKVFDEALEATDVAAYVDTEKLERARAQAAACVEAWNVVHGDYAEYFTILRKELDVRADPKATIDSPMEMRMAGKIDGIVMDHDSYRLWLLEHKTRYSLKDFDFVNGLDLDHQCLFYVLLYAAWLQREKAANKNKPVQVTVNRKKVELGQVAGLYYDAIAKPQHRSGDTFDELKNRMVKAMVEDPSKYFAFVPIEFKREMVDRARDNFRRVIARMDNLTPDTVTMNLSACNNYGGCPYRAICKQGVSVSDPLSVLQSDAVQLYRIADVHEELEDITEAEL